MLKSGHGTLNVMFRFWILFLAVTQLVPAQSAEQFFQSTFDGMVRADPEFATSVGRHEQDDRWTDWSKSGRMQRHQFFEERLRTANGFHMTSLSPEDKLTMRLVQYDFRSRLDAWELETHLLRVGQLFGLHNRVYSIVDRMPARTVRDYGNIIARLRAIPSYVDQNIGIMDEAIAGGMMQPRVVADLVVQQLAAQMKQDAEHSHLLDSFRKFPSNIPTTEQDRLRGEATEAYNQQFLPAWRKLHDYMVNTYTPHVRPSVSLSSIPGGREDYAILVRRLTTTNMKPEEIHSLGEAEVKRIEGEMQAIMAQTGFTGSLEEFQRHLQASADQHFRSKEEMLVYCRNIAKIIEPQLPNQFRHLPMLLYGVRPIPEDREAATATNAQAPSPDFTTPGWFNLNTYQPEKQVKYDKEALVLHEAVPGHIFQITLAQAQPHLPAIRKFYGNSAYIEGWALYAESLGGQLGLYSDPYSRFGQLASERFRAVRLVVDTGIHELGWTREQAVEYFRAHAPEESLAEIDRYISWPAQALSYKMGQLRIRFLRGTAENRLGARFDVREFHDVVLHEGTLPLELLTEQINAYVDGAASK
jgi:uncharacterized protein (DUF885 family)